MPNYILINYLSRKCYYTKKLMFQISVLIFLNFLILINGYSSNIFVLLVTLLSITIVTYFFNPECLKTPKRWKVILY